jgi:hypothetical protein
MLHEAAQVADLPNYFTVYLCEVLCLIAFPLHSPPHSLLRSLHPQAGPAREGGEGADVDSDANSSRSLAIFPHCS